MSAAEVLDALLRVNLAAGAAILGVIALRKAVRRRFGARLAYGLWLLPVLAGAAVMVPARQVVIVQPAPVLAAAARVHQTYAAPARALAPAPLAAISVDPLAVLVAIWLLGVVGAALIMASLQRRFMRQARGGAVGPAVVGVIAPRIVTPADFHERYSHEEQALVLAHEQAHIARHDSRLNGLSSAAQCLCWFNPLAHLAAHLMRVDQELACDEAVVSRFPGARRAYAEVLLKAQLAILPLPLGCYWPSKTQHPLVERVAMLKLKEIGRRRRLAGAAALATLCAGSGFAAWAAQPADVRLTVAPTHDTAGPTKMAVAATNSESLRSVQPAARISTGGEAALQQPSPVTPSGSTTDDDDKTAGDTPPPGLVAEGQAPSQGPIDISADSLTKHPDQHRVAYAGDVEVVFDGHRLESDALDLYFDKSAKVTDSGDRADFGELRTVEAQGHVSYAFGDQTAQADAASYDPSTNLITLSGNAMVASGQTITKGDKLVLDVKDGQLTEPGGASPSTENALRRWIASVQLHQLDEADMSPALIEAARRQDTSSAQLFRAFGKLQTVRFVRPMAQGLSAYEADFAHGKINIVVGPLTADGKLDQLRWGAIWAAPGERPKPGVPLAP